MVKISKTLIWWDDTGDNKPDDVFFASFKSQMTEANLKINYIDSRTINIVVDTKDITYIWIEQNFYNYYYYYTGIVKILPNGYVLEFKLDIFTTYTLPYFMYLEENNIAVKLNRHKKFDSMGLTWEDEMLNTIPLIYVGTNYTLDASINTPKDNSRPENDGSSGPGGGTTHHISLDKQGWGTPGYYYNTHFTDKNLKEHLFTNWYNPVMYMVFGGLDEDGSLTMVPVLGATGCIQVYFDEKSPNAPPWYGKAAQFQGVKKIYHNTLAEMEAILLRGSLGNTPLSKKFIGMCIGIPYYKVNKRYTATLEISYVVGKASFLCVKMSSEGIKLGDYVFTSLSGINFDYSYPKIMNSNTLSFYASNVFEMCLYGEKVKPSMLKDLPSGVLTTFPQDWRLDKATFNYTTGSSISYYSKFFYSGNNVISLPDDLPVFIDEYITYIGTTKATRDTGLAIAAQQAALGLFGVGADYAQSFTKKKPEGNKFKLFGGVGEVLGFTNKVAMMDAELRNTKAISSTQIIAGSIEDNAKAKAFIRYLRASDGSIKFGDCIEYKGLSVGTIRALNNVLYLYGQFNPKISYISNLKDDDSSAKFQYYKFDAEYLSNIFSTTIRGAEDVPVEREYYDEVFQTLTGGIRLWSETPIW